MEIHVQTAERLLELEVDASSDVHETLRTKLSEEMYVSEDAALIVCLGEEEIPNDGCKFSDVCEPGARLNVGFKVTRVAFEDVYDKEYLHNFFPDEPRGRFAMESVNGVLKSECIVNGANIDLGPTPPQLEYHRHLRLLYMPTSFFGYAVFRLKEEDEERVLWGIEVA